MPQREIKLDTAAFLDSPACQALQGVEREDARRIAERFLTCAYDELGIAPHLLDAEGMHALVGHLMPAHFQRQDPLLPHVVPVLRAYLDFLEQEAVVTQAFEIRRALESTAEEFESAVRTGREAQHAGQAKREPFVHKAQKTGRNDPCPCGSGKKFKQCCLPSMG